jgi:hypothetical protein
MANWSVDFLFNWFIDCFFWLPIWLLTNSSTGRLFVPRLFDCVSVQTNNSLFHPSVTCSTDWLINKLNISSSNLSLGILDGCLSDQLIDHRLDIHLTYWLIDRLVVCSCDWLVGLLAICSTDWLLTTQRKKSADMLPQSIRHSDRGNMMQRKNLTVVNCICSNRTFCFSWLLSVRS